MIIKISLASMESVISCGVKCEENGPAGVNDVPCANTKQFTIQTQKWPSRY